MSAPILAPRPTVPPVLYVGGPLHATLWHAEAGQTEPDPIHQHVTANGEVVGYARQPFNYDMREPTNPQVILQRWTMWLYLERELTGQQPDIVMQVVTDAMFRWFTTTHGKLATDQSHGPGNGKVTEPVMVYEARCAECGAQAGHPDEPLIATFTNAKARAEWMRVHIETTGHSPGWKNVDPASPSPVTPDAQEGPDDGGNR